MNFGNSFVGGQVLITAEKGSDTITKTFKIIGTNPGGSAVKSHIDTKSLTTFQKKVMKAIANKESGGTYNQFGNDRFPLPNLQANGLTDGGYGVMQLTTILDNRPNQLWNWKINVDRGVSHYTGYATTKANNWWSAFSKDYAGQEPVNNPPTINVSYSSRDGGTITFKKVSGTDAVSVQAYNGFGGNDYMYEDKSVKPSKKYRTCWKWDTESKPPKWIFYPNTNNYVKKIDSLVE